MPVVGPSVAGSAAEHTLCVAARMPERLVKPIAVDPLVENVLYPSCDPAETLGAGMAVSVDWAALAERYGQRAGFVERLVKAVLTSHGATPQRLREAAAAADSAAIADLAHALKGTGGNLMVSELRDLARAVESDARAGNTAAVEGARRLAGSVDTLLASLAAHVAA